MDVNTMALESLPESQRLAGLQGSLTSHKGQVLCRLGSPEKGVVWLKKSYEIRSHDVPFSPRNQLSPQTMPRRDSPHLTTSKRPMCGMVVHETITKSG